MSSNNHLSPQQPREPRAQASNLPQNNGQAAAEVLHQKIDRIYEQAPPNQLKDESPQVAEGSTYDRTYSDYDWQQYHSAWQQYYQQYYQRYYLQQLHVQRQHAASEKAKAAASHTTLEESGVVTGHDVSNAVQRSQVAELRAKLLHTIGHRSQKLRRSNHFMPIVSALAVGLIFLFLQYNRFMIAEVQAYVSPGSSISESDTILVDPTANLNVGAEPKLIIPKINVNIRVVYDVTSLQDGPVQEGLKRGVVHYKLPGANSLPGQVGNTVLLGHSSNDIFDPGDYKFAFVLLDKLQPDDLFYIHYEGKRYIYKVTEKKTIKPTEINALHVNTNKPMATLVTCTPLGTATNRLLVFAEQISPDPSGALKPSSGAASSSDPVLLPGNSPTLLERIQDFFF
jgi:sortase A